MKRLIIGGLMVVVLLSMLCGCKAKECEFCGETYRGRSHKITLWGETGDVCKECYQDYLELIGVR